MIRKWNCSNFVDPKVVGNQNFDVVLLIENNFINVELK